ncbi:MAG: sulfatase [Bacteroidales bacterium]|nr:sulfatase [Bacteroidales bacterium]
MFYFRKLVHLSGQALAMGYAGFHLIGLAGMVLFSTVSCTQGDSLGTWGTGKPNVLLIAIDDLRPELNCYGAEHIHSPNIDKVAADGILFENAFTQQAVCAPSRNTLMTGLRPDGLGIHDLSTFFRDKAPDVITLPQYFKTKGYQAEGMGKIYHTGHGNQNDTQSWSRPHWTPAGIIGQRELVKSGDTVRLHTCYPTINGKKIPWLNSAMTEELHDDALTTTHALERMNALKDSSFFLVVGFRKPHLPFVAPQKYWDLYDPRSINIPSRDQPKGIPIYAFSNWGELRKYHNMPEEGYLPDADARQMIHGYCACVSFIDAQVGRLVQELKHLGLYDNTIIVLWSDHGWKLGDYGEWCKHTNYEIDTRIPVIVRVPGIHDQGVWKSDVIIETVDIYPTLCDLAGLDIPGHVQGNSFSSALLDDQFAWDDVAFSQYPRTFSDERGQHAVMGTSMRTREYRITRWTDTGSGELLATELYDHSGNRLELENLAGLSGKEELLKSLTEQFEMEYIRSHQ